MCHWGNIKEITYLESLIFVEMHFLDMHSIQAYRFPLQLFPILTILSCTTTYISPKYVYNVFPWIYPKHPQAQGCEKKRRYFSILFWNRQTRIRRFFLSFFWNRAKFWPLGFFLSFSRFHGKSPRREAPGNIFQGIFHPARSAGTFFRVFSGAKRRKIFPWFFS